MKLSLKKLTGPIRGLLTSSLPIGGLEISDTSIRFLRVRNNSIIQASLKIPPGIVQHGKIVNKPLLLTALKKVHTQITDKQKAINVVLTISSDLIYAQSFSVPIVERGQMAESISLNLQMLSPTEIDKSYFDYQEIKENKNLGTIDLLGAFSKKKVVDEYEEVLKDTGFNAVAIEFPGLSLARLIKQRWGGLIDDQRYLAISLSTQGILMMILNNGNLYFHHFTPWREILQKNRPNKGISFAEIKNFFTEEIQKVLNFYLGKFGKPLEETILVSPLFNYEIVKLVSEHFGLKIRNLAIAELPKLKPHWFTVLGAGLRGLISRSRDTNITLTETKAQDEYYYERGLHFLSLWRNISVGVFVFLLFSFAVTATVLNREEGKIAAKIESEFSLEDASSQILAQGEIDRFNILLALIASAVDSERQWSGTLKTISNLGGSAISLTRVHVGDLARPVGITATATSEQEAVAFKSRLNDHPEFYSAFWPLSGINTDVDGTTTFSLSFSIVGVTETEPETPTRDQEDT